MISPSLEREKLRLEREKLDLERTKAMLEVQKVRLTVVSIYCTVFAACLALVGTLIAQYVQSKSQHEIKILEANSQFELKAAELVLATQSAEQAKATAKALYSLFPQKLPRSFSESFPSELHAFGPDIVEAKTELLKLLASRSPREQTKLIAYWCQLFREDTTFKCKE